MTTGRKTIPPVPPSPEAKKHARSSLPWSEQNDGGKFATPHELKMARTAPGQRIPPGPRVGDDVSSVFMPAEDLYWIKDSLHNLRKEKADRALLLASMKTVEEQLDMFETRLNKATHCHRESDFEELKDAVNSWRSFFRNTVAVGFLGALIVVGGWLWQYYALVDQVTKTSGDVTQTSHNVSILRDDYAKYKQDRFAESVKYSAENDARFMQLEYRLLTAMAKLSQGQKIDTPVAPIAAPSDIPK